MTTLLERLVELIADEDLGVNVTFIQLDDHSPCQFPQYAGTTSYKRGCRCRRCRDAQQGAQRRCDARAQRR